MTGQKAGNGKIEGLQVYFTRSRSFQQDFFKDSFMVRYNMSKNKPK